MPWKQSALLLVAFLTSGCGLGLCAGASCDGFIRFTSDTYPFAAIYYGDTLDVAMTLTNISEETISDLNQGQIEPPYEFKGGTFPGQGGTCGSGEMAPGAQCTVVLEYSPTHPNPGSAVFDVSFFRPSYSVSGSGSFTFEDDALAGDPGTLDIQTFNVGTGYASVSGQRVIQLASGKVLVGNAFGITGSTGALRLTRFDRKGTLDTTYGTSGVLQTPTVTSGLARIAVLDPSGEAFLASMTATGFPGRAYRFAVDGSLLDTFATASDGINDIEVYDALLQPDSKLLVGAASASATSRTALIRWDVDGNLDSSLAGSGVALNSFGAVDLDRIDRIAPLADGKIVYAGRSQNGAVDEAAVYRVLSDGTFDNTFNTNGRIRTGFANSVVITALAVQPDGKILVAGYNSVTSVPFLLRHLSSGPLDPDFNGDGILSAAVRANSILIQEDGRILLFGTSPTAGPWDYHIAGYTTAGELDPSFGTSGVTSFDLGHANEQFLHAAFQSDGKFLVVGTSTGGQIVARFWP